MPQKQFIKKQATNPSQNQINILINLYQSNQMRKVESFCRKLLKTFPKSLAVLNILGAAFAKQSKLEKALEVFDKMIKIDSNLAQAYYNRGVIFQQLERLDKAVDSYNKALQLKSDHVEAYSNRGLALQELGELNKALKDQYKAIKLKPDYAEAYSNLGIALQELGRPSEALKSYDKAIQLKPDYAKAYNNRGATLKELWQLDSAIRDHNKAIQLKPDFAQAYYNRGLALQDKGQLKKAIESYEKAIQLKSDYVKAHSNRNFALNYSSETTPANIFYKHLDFEKQFGIKTSKDKPKKIFNKTNNTILKIGYLSADFNDHSVAYFFEPLIKSHDKNSIEVYCYYNHTLEDSVTKRLINESQHWRSIVKMNDKDVVNLIKKDDIDILVDLSGHTAKNRLKVFAYKPAAIQVTWLGYPNTTGLTAIDYRFTDDVADPIGASDNLYTEKLIRLPNGFLCYQGNDLVPTNNTPPCLKQGHVTFGSFNNFNKITPEVIKIWSKILHHVPKSQIVLKSKQFSSSEATSRCLGMFEQEGIPKSRIKCYSWIPEKENHLTLYNSIDIGLDTFPYNGTTTTCEALWMGVPTITISGESHVARVGSSIMIHAGLKELIAVNIDDYVNIAVKYASNKERLVELRSELRDKIKNSDLCDSGLFAKNIEQAYQQMWDRYLCVS